MKKGEVAWNRGLVGVYGGWKLSSETREKMRLSHTGTRKPLAVRRKISASQIGVPKPTSGVRGSKHHNFNPNRTEFQRYRRLVQRETEKNYRAHVQVINPCEYPRTKNGIRGGYQLDHKISVKEGFDKKIPIHEIAHINNLQMLRWQDNRTKGV
jgi:hypothetical protein